MIIAEDTRDARLTELLEGTGGDLAGLSNDELAELDAAREAQSLLAGLAQEAPPRDFVRKVQRRLRRRSGGQYFHPMGQQGGYKLSIEIFAVIAVVVMAACWLFLEAERRAGSPGELTEIPPMSPVTAPKLP
jgi:hypothetical protein